MQLISFSLNEFFFFWLECSLISVLDEIFLALRAAGPGLRLDGGQGEGRFQAERDQLHERRARPPPGGKPQPFQPGRLTPPLQPTFPKLSGESREGSSTQP